MADELSRVFVALADPTRRDIVARLVVGDAGLVTRGRETQTRPVHLEEVFDPRNLVDRALSQAFAGTDLTP